MKRAGLIVCILAPYGPAFAEDLPRFDIRVHCAAQGSTTRIACVRAEEQAKTAIVARWDVYPKQRKHFCVQSVTFRSKEQRSYVTLAECLDDPSTS